MRVNRNCCWPDRVLTVHARLYFNRDFNRRIIAGPVKFLHETIFEYIYLNFFFKKKKLSVTFSRYNTATTSTDGTIIRTGGGERKEKKIFESVYNKYFSNVLNVNIFSNSIRIICTTE